MSHSSFGFETTLTVIKDTRFFFFFFPSFLSTGEEEEEKEKEEEEMDDGPARGGTRGGRDQFSWDAVKLDPHRENYLGHLGESIRRAMATRTGRVLVREEEKTLTRIKRIIMRRRFLRTKTCCWTRRRPRFGGERKKSGTGSFRRPGKADDDDDDDD